MLQITEEQLSSAIDALNKGGVIVFPTETSYGIGCDATNAEAVARVFAIKGRPAGKGLPLILPSMESAFDYVEMNEAAAGLAQKHWPGSLNIVAPVKHGSSVAAACSQGGAQSVRVSSHPIAATLARRFGRPIVATSANLSGEEAVYTIKHIRDAFKGRAGEIDFILDGGSLPERPASTTVRVDGERVEVLRQGAIQV